MRYPLWAFLFVFVVPPYALHAGLTGAAAFVEVLAPPVQTMDLSEGTLSAQIRLHRF